MKIRSYRREIQNSTAQMLDVFNDIVIDRRDKDNHVQQLITVPCVYGSRSRILKSLENRNNTVQLPLVCISISGLRRDNSRVHSIHDGLLRKSGSSSFSYLENTPVPINITYTMTILTKFQEDMDQILSNWLVWFNPDIYVVIPHPVIPGENLKCQIVSDGNIPVVYPEELDKNSPVRVVATTTFEFRTWLFPGLDGDKYEGKIIKRINFTGALSFDTDGIGRLNGFYAVPNSMSLDAYKENIILGLIKPPNWDVWQISGGLAGLWHDVSGIVSGTNIDDIVIGDPSNACYLTVSGEDLSGILLITDRCYLPSNMEGLTVYDYVDYYNSVYNPSGELYGYNGAYGYGLTGELSGN